MQKIVTCQDCIFSLTKLELETHFEICPDFKLDCPNNCEKMVKRKELEFHKKNDCENCVIKCDYFNKGCQEQLFKKELENHLQTNTKEHLKLVENYLDHLTAIVNDLKGNHYIIIFNLI